MERRFYSNYDLWEDYAEQAIEFLKESDERYKDEEPSDSDVWDEIYFNDEMMWDEIKTEIFNFFNDRTVIIFGRAGGWRGESQCWEIGNFESLFWKAIRNEDYIEISDNNGHFCIDTSNHDGSSHYEIKLMSDNGMEFYDDWNYGDDPDILKISQNKACKMIINSSFSKLPKAFHNIYEK